MTTLAPDTKSLQQDAKNPWLHAWYDPLAGLKTMTSCVRLGDLHGDADSKLCICDTEKKSIIVYKGTAQAGTYELLDVPVAMCITYAEATQPRIPTLAVAAGSYIFMYRNMRPYKKWTCPAIEISDAEQGIWSDLKTNTVDTNTAISLLAEARENGIVLSSRSADLIALESEDEREAFVEQKKDEEFSQQTLITCMEVLKKDSDEHDAVSLLIVGTEAGQVYVLQRNASDSAFTSKIDLPSTPVHMCVSGLFDVEWRVMVTCRDGRLYSIKNGDTRDAAVLSGSVVDLGSQPVAIDREEKSIWVATMDRTVSSYNAKGKRSKTLVIPDDITDICSIVMKRSKISNLLVVGTAEGEVRLYRDATLVHMFTVEKPVLAVRFGPYGREENTLIVIHGQGYLTIKMWKRNADIENVNLMSGPPPEQDIPLPVPKKTKLYVEQTQRERDNAPQMHRAFQRDLCKLRLETARSYVKTLTDGQLGTHNVGSADVRVHAQVQGLGPLFVLRVSLQNAGSQPITGSRLLLTFDPEMYAMGQGEGSQQSIPVPILLPGPKYLVEAEVMNIDAQGRAGQVVLLLFNPNSGSALPMLSATVRMPTSELLTI